MATAQANMRAPAATPSTATVTFAKKRQFAWKTLLLAALTLALGLVVLWKASFAAQLYLAALAAVHVGALAVFVARTRREDLAPSAFGLFWRVVGLAVALALLGMIRLVPDSPWFWPSLAGIWVVHTGGLTLLHVRAVPGAPCPFVPRAWRKPA